MNYVDPSGHEAFSNPNNQTSACNKTGGSGSTSSGSTPQYQTGSPSNETSPYTKQAACKEISIEDFLTRSIDLYVNSMQRVITYRTNVWAKTIGKFLYLYV